MKSAHTDGEIAAIDYLGFARCALAAGWNPKTVVGHIAACFPHEYQKTAECIVEIAELESQDD